jgi:immune inhibitor A
VHKRRLFWIAAVCLLLGAGCRDASQGRPRASGTPTARVILPPTVTLSAPSDTEVATSATQEPTGEPTHAMYIAPMPRREREAALQGSNAETTVPVIGTMRAFRVADLRALGYRSVDATLRYTEADITMWVEQGVDVEAHALAVSVQSIIERILPALARLYPNSALQEEPARYAILNVRTVGMSGYYAAPQHAAVEQTDDTVLVMNISAAQPGTERYDSVLAHELQHARLSQVDLNESAWLSEGASQFLETLAGFPPPIQAIEAFAAAPGVQLNTWSSAGSEVFRHYGATFLLMQYFYEQYGLDGVRALLGASEDGTAAFERVLGTHGTGFRDLYADWALANLLDRPEMNGGVGGYAGIDLDLEPQDSLSAYPARLAITTPPYATRYMELQHPLEDTPVSLTIELDAPENTRLVAAHVPEGPSMWWSNRGDLGHSWLQKSLDLSQATEATLTYDLWYDIEPGWDWAGVRVSIDDGEHWAWLRGEQSVAGSAGTGAPDAVYTGRSGGSPPDGTRDARWVAERIDLTPYAGQDVLLRFDMFTDDALTGPGLCLDNIAVDAVGWRDADSDGEGWITSGFVRTNGTVPIEYSVQAVVYSGEGVTVHHLTAPNGHGTWLLPDLGGTIDRAVLVISAMTDPMGPLTTEPIPIVLSVLPAP